MKECHWHQKSFSLYFWEMVDSAFQWHNSHQEAALPVPFSLFSGRGCARWWKQASREYIIIILSILKILCIVCRKKKHVKFSISYSYTIHLTKVSLLVLYFVFIQGILLYSWRSRGQPTVYKGALQRWTRDHWTQIYCIKSVHRKANGLSYGSQGNWHIKFMFSYWYNMYGPMSCAKSNIVYHQI